MWKCEFYPGTQLHTPSWQFIVFQSKLHFIHNFSSNTAVLKMFLLRNHDVLSNNVQTACPLKISWFEKHRIAQHAYVWNTSCSFTVHFVGISWEAHASTRVAFGACFWNISFIQQQQGQNAFTLFCLSHLIVSTWRFSLLITYQVHLGAKNVSWKTCHW